MEGKKLIAYFSCTGKTKTVSEKLSKLLNSDIYEIIPKEKYTDSDLNWNNKKSRSSIEMADPKSRVELKDKNLNINDYNIIYLGFPIWWGVAPHIINTFLESYDFTNKNIVLWGTSHATDFGDSVISNLSNSCKGHLIQGVIFNKEHIKEDDVKKFVKGL